MDINEEIRETLKKQLELLSKRSELPNTKDNELPVLTHAMIEVVAVLQANFT